MILSQKFNWRQPLLRQYRRVHGLRLDGTCLSLFRHISPILPAEESLLLSQLVVSSDEKQDCASAPSVPRSMALKI